MQPIYLDYNATTPIHREVAEAMTPFLFEHFGNPSSSHSYGATTKRAIEKARSQAAALLGCRNEEVVFTSGGTESNNYAIRGVAEALSHRGRHIITSAVEHPAVTEVCAWLKTQGFEITILPVDSHGLVEKADLERVIRADTILVTVMHANNEVGTIEPIAELAEVAHRHGAWMHTDAAQSAGKIPVSVEALGVDLLSLAGHKLYAPKGIGALFIGGHVQLAKLMHGAAHEAGRRPGTENVLEIVGLGQACEIALRDQTTNIERSKALRDRLHRGLVDELGAGGVRLNGHPEQRLPNTLSLSFPGLEANTLVDEIGIEVAASAGAACHAGEVDLSAVLEAMAVPIEWAMGTVRFSTGRHTTEEEIDRAVEVVSAAVARLAPGDTAVRSKTIAADGEIRLTRFTHGLGCACKLRPQELEQVLARLPAPQDPNLLVGTDSADDAAVYRLNNDIALVQTVDFFTPIVDDPYQFGAISAANSLSDIYAMGGRPIFALNIVGFPSSRLPLSVLEQILLGARDKAAEAGIEIVGGHTVEDNEPKFGLAVTGMVHPAQLLRNDTAQPGDALVLTKPIGVGILTTAIKRGLAANDDVQRTVTLMATLNGPAAEAALSVGANACTDITGFGLLGHLREIAAGSMVEVTLCAGDVPVLAAARDFAAAGVVPGGSKNNLEHVSPHVTFAKTISPVERLILADAQTSGGLLICLPAERAPALLAALRERGIADAAHIGSVTGPGDGRVSVVP